MGGSPDAKETPPPPGVDPFYWKLTKVKDRSIKAAAERYVSLVRTQEWSDLSGKFRTVARYVKHDPNLTSVTIETLSDKKQKTVPVDKLSKVCQSRVRQIDATQKNLKEWAAAHPEEAGAGAAAGAAPMPQDAGAPMNDEAGAQPAPELPAAPAATAAGPEGGAPPAAPPSTEPDPSASDPDPLGFAELPPAPAAPLGAEPPPGSEPAPN